MNNLLNKKCVPCEGGILPFDISEIHKYQKKVDGWEVKKNDEKVPFFNLGPDNDWKKILDKDQQSKLKDIFKEDLTKLGYE
jgi:hypothetical protein